MDLYFLCEPCGDMEGPGCEGCGYCRECCNCSDLDCDCDCDVCVDRRKIDDEEWDWDD